MEILGAQWEEQIKNKRDAVSADHIREADQMAEKEARVFFENLKDGDLEDYIKSAIDAGREYVTFETDWHMLGTRSYFVFCDWLKDHGLRISAVASVPDSKKAAFSVYPDT